MMMEENSQIEKKSLRLFSKLKPDWNELAKDCVCFANAFGGHIYIGIEDDELMPPAAQYIPENLSNKIIKTIQNLTINVAITATIKTAENGGKFIDLLILRTSSTIASTSNGRYYIRVEDDCKPIMPDELSRLLNDKQAFVWEMQQYLKVSRNDFDKSKLNIFLKDIQSSERVSHFVKQKNIDELLDYYLFANGSYLTNLGVLWIGKREHRAKLLYTPIVQFIKYNEIEQKVKKLVWDDYSLNPKELIETIWEAIPEFRESIEYPDGIFRKSISNYDEVVVREIIANALVHRPYTTRGDIFINMYPDRLEIHNPGILPLGVTPKNILHKSVQRNPHLSKVFYDLKLMEKEGSGYDRMYEVLLTSGKSIPNVLEQNDRVVVSIKKQIINSDIINFLDKIRKEIQLKSKELIALGLIAQNNTLTLKELSKYIGLDDILVSKDWVSRLVELNLVKTKGKTKGMTYYVDNELLTRMQYKEATNLKTIESHRLRELIREDLKKYPNSSRREIHQRIGKEIPERTLRNEIKKLIENGIIVKKGSTIDAKYYLTLFLNSVK